MRNVRFLTICFGFVAPLMGADVPMVKTRQPVGLTPEQVKDLSAAIDTTQAQSVQSRMGVAEALNKLVTSMGSLSDGVAKQIEKLWQTILTMQDEQTAAREAFKHLADKTGITPVELSEIFSKEVEVAAPASMAPLEAVPAALPELTPTMPEPVAVPTVPAADEGAPTMPEQSISDMPIMPEPSTMPVEPVAPVAPASPSPMPEMPALPAA